MDRLVKSGEGWRLGWNPTASVYRGLVGGEDWAFELTEAEFNDFCRLIEQLAQTMSQMAGELMDEERIACEVESDLLWLEAEGYPQAYDVRLILNSGRQCEGNFPHSAVPGLLEALKTLAVF